MIKRPLFTGCIAAVAILGGLLLAGKGTIFLSPALKEKAQFAEGETVYVKGEITRIEIREKQTVLTLKKAEIRADREGEGAKAPPDSVKSRGLLLYVQDVDSVYSIGEGVLGKGSLQWIEPPGNLGEFDAEKYYLANNIDYRIFSAEIIKRDGKKDWYLDGLSKLAERLKKSIEGVFCEEDAGLMESILLGNKENLDEDIYSLYQLAGIAHLLAISGLHMGLAGRGIYGLLRKMGASFLLAFFFSMLFLLSYGLLTGMGSSALRAFLMFGLAMFARVCGRTNDLLTSASLALLFMGLENPWILTQAGVWLSFGAVFAIGGVYPALEGFFSPGNPIGKSFLLSFSIHLFTVPILCNSYFQICIYSNFLNLLVLPLMSAVFLSGASAAVLGFLSQSIGKLAALPAHWILKLYAFLAKLFLKFPGAIFLIGKPKIWQILFYYLILGLLLLLMRRSMKRKKDCFRRGFFVKGATLALAILLPLVLCHSERKGLIITMLDVGQGDGIYVKLPEGQSVFLDGGSSSEKEVGAYRIEPFLKAVRKRNIDIWAISHGDGDHYSGLLEVFQEVEMGNFSIGEVWLPDVANPGEGYAAIEKQAEALGISVKKISEGMTYKNGDFMLTCLHPEAGYVSESENAYSATLLLQYKSFSGLFTGDLEKGGEEAVRAELKKRDAENLTFLKVAHHGSANSTKEEFCEGLQIKFGFISAGKENSYGHPSPEVVERLEKMGVRLYSTIESGALTLWTDGERLEIEEFKRPQ